MEDSKYKEFLEQRHPELLKEAEDFFDVSDRGTWEYVCKLMPKLADLPHEKIDPDTMNREFGWYVYREVQLPTPLKGVSLYGSRCFRGETDVRLGG